MGRLSDKLSEDSPGDGFFSRMLSGFYKAADEASSSMVDSLNGYRLKPGAVPDVDYGWSMPGSDESPYERVPDTIRFLDLLGGIIPIGRATAPVRAAATAAAKTGAGSKTAAAVARDASYAGAEAKGLPMDAASRAKRASDMGYSDEVFYRGDPKQPGQYNGGAFFSRSKEYADGFAEGAADAYRLSPGRTLSLDGTIKASDFADIMRGVERANGAEAAKRFAKAIPIDKTGITPEWVSGLAKHRPDLELMNGASAHQILDVVTGDAVSALKAAGYRAIDTGRDVRMLSETGIRRADAAFDPARWDSKNIFAARAPLATPTSSQHRE